MPTIVLDGEIKKNKKNMKRYCVLILLCVICTKVTAQHEFKHNAGNVWGKCFDVNYKLPRGFKDLNTKERWEKEDSSYFSRLNLMPCCPVISSKDEECLLLYMLPYFFPDNMTRMAVAMRGREETVESYRRGAHRFQINMILENIYDEDQYVFEDLVTIFSEKEARSRFNADSILLFTIPIPEGILYRDKYKHATCMYIYKDSRPFVGLFLFFTEKGFRKSEKYISRLNKTIWYKDGWVHDNKKIEKARSILKF